jgi:hypothetical protein
LIVPVCGGDRRIALWRPKAARPGDKLGRLCLAEVFVQPPCGARLSKEGDPAEKGQNAKKDTDVD